MLLRPHTTKTTIYVAMKIVGAGIGFVNAILLARILGAREFGLLSLVLAAANLGGTFGALGLPYFITKEVSILRDAGRFDCLAVLVRNAQWLTFLGAMSYLIIVFGAKSVVSVDTTTFGALPAILLVLGAVFVPVATGNQVRAGVIRGMDRAIAADFPDVITRPAVVLIAVAILLATRIQVRAAGGMLIQLTGAVVAFLVGGRLLRGFLRRPITGVNYRDADRVGSDVRMLAILKEAPHFLVITFLSTMDVQVSIYLLGFFLGPAQVGIFQVAAQPLNIILMGLVAAGVSMQARLAAAWAARNKARTQEILSEATRFSTLVALGVGLPLLAFAGFIVRLYGPEYEPAVVLLRILTIGQMIQGITGPIGVVMLMTGNQRKLMYFDLPFLAFKVVVISAGIHFFGLVGAAVGEVAYLAVMRFGGVVFVYRQTGLVTTMWGMRHES